MPADPTTDATITVGDQTYRPSPSDPETWEVRHSSGRWIDCDGEFSTHDVERILDALAAARADLARAHEALRTIVAHADAAAAATWESNAYHAAVGALIDAALNARAALAAPGGHAEGR